MYELVDSMPEDGHFLLLWTYNGKVWNETLTYFDDGWRKYEVDSDDYSSCPDPLSLVPRAGENIQFLIAR